MTLPLLGAGPSASGFSPVSASLLGSPIVSLMRAAGTMWQDSGKTIPAVAVDDPVRVFDCTFTGKEFTADDDNRRALLKNSGSLWWLEFDGSGVVENSDRYNFTPATTETHISVSAHFAANKNGTNTGYVLERADAATSRFRFKLYESGKMVGEYDSGNFTASSTTIAVSTDFVGGINFGASGPAVYWLNGASDGVGFADVGPINLQIAPSLIGTSPTGGVAWKGRIYGFAIYTASQTDAYLTLLHRWLGGFAGMSL